MDAAGRGRIQPVHQQLAGERAQIDFAVRHRRRIEFRVHANIVAGRVLFAVPKFGGEVGSVKRAQNSWHRWAGCNAGKRSRTPDDAAAHQVSIRGNRERSRVGKAGAVLDRALRHRRGLEQAAGELIGFQKILRTPQVDDRAVVWAVPIDRRSEIGAGGGGKLLHVVIKARVEVTHVGAVDHPKQSCLCQCQRTGWSRVLPWDRLIPDPRHR